MKRVFQHPPEKPSLTGRKYWRSVGELNDTPEFRGWLEREFPAGAAEMEGDNLSRRNFLQLMGASLALAGFGLSGCRRPEGYLVPYTKAVEWEIPGRNVLFATSMPRRHGAMPLVASTTEGRPIKLEGNGLHPLSNGSTDPIAQCALLDLYDPDRSRAFLEHGQPVDVKKFQDFMKTTRDAMLANGGAGAAILVEETFSPTRDRLRAQLSKDFPNLLWCVYDPLRPFNDVEATRAAFGDGTRLVHRFDRADVILSLDSDFLNLDEGGIEATRDYSNRRRVASASDSMNRLYVVENRYTLTGGKADHRLRLPASQIGAFAVALGRKVAGLLGGTGAALGNLLGAFPAEMAGRFATQDKWLTEVANDLIASRGKSLVITGRRQPAGVHLLVQAINGVLGNIGHTVVAHASESRGGAEPTSISGLAEAIDAKKVQTLFILGGNPAYNALANLNWADKQKSIPNVVRLGYHEDETSELAAWHVPMAHFLEQWGDARSSDGTYCVIQPMILPLFGGLSDLQFISLLLGQESHDKPDLVRATFEEIGAKTANFPADKAMAWNAFLRDGFLPGTAAPDTESGFNVGGALGYIKANLAAQFPAPTPAGQVEVVLIDDYKVDDGRYANNGWLQEMPHPITKMAWDNAILVNQKTANALGLNVTPPMRRLHRRRLFARQRGQHGRDHCRRHEDQGRRAPFAPATRTTRCPSRSATAAAARAAWAATPAFDAYPLRTAQNDVLHRPAAVDPAGGRELPTRHHPAASGDGRPQSGARAADCDLQGKRRVHLR